MMLFKAHSEKYDDIVIALCGVFQCAALINDLASFGNCDEALFELAIQSIFMIDAPNVVSIFGGLGNLHRGAAELFAVFNRKKSAKQPNANLSRYAVSSLFMQRQLMKYPNKLEELQQKILKIKNQADYFSVTHEQVIANLSELYLSIVGHFRTRIQIVGRSIYLNNPQILEKIRALFLAALRASVLWQQVGGRRWQLFFARNTCLISLHGLFNVSIL